MKRYPFLDLSTVNARYSDALKEACSRVIDSGRYIGGSEVSGFESRLSKYVGSGYAVGVANGLDALRLILRAYIQLGCFKRGDEVIVPANTFIATVLAVTDSGLIPVFVDPDIATHNIDVASVAKAVTPRTCAVIAVHLYGLSAYSPELADYCRLHGLKLIEDSAQAIGAEASGLMCGHQGDAAAFSFYPTKNMGALGDGGIVTTDDAELADTVRILANYGSRSRYENIMEGLNSRLDPIQAAMLSVKLDHIDSENDGRRELAAIYNSTIDHNHVIKPVEPSGYRHVYHQYVIRTDNRERFRRYMADNGVETDIHYPVPPHRQPCYARYASVALPVAERLASEVVSLPISPACTSPADASEIADIINRYN